VKGVRGGGRRAPRPEALVDCAASHTGAALGPVLARGTVALDGGA